MGIKIRMVKINGQDRVPPECMRILIAFAKHRDSCQRCYRAYHAANADYCPTGTDILNELAAQPEVAPTDDPPNQPTP